MSAGLYQALTQEIRTLVPIEARAEVSCRFLWERIIVLKKIEDSPTILRLSRHGLKLATIAQSSYYEALFSTMKGAMERRLSL